jgi:hypothetical protein
MIFNISIAKDRILKMKPKPPDVRPNRFVGTERPIYDREDPENSPGLKTL